MADKAATRREEQYARSQEELDAKSQLLEHKTEEWAAVNAQLQRLKVELAYYKIDHWDASGGGDGGRGGGRGGGGGGGGSGTPSSFSGGGGSMGLTAYDGGRGGGTAGEASPGSGRSPSSQRVDPALAKDMAELMSQRSTLLQRRKMLRAEQAEGREAALSLCSLSALSLCSLALLSLAALSLSCLLSLCLLSL